MCKIIINFTYTKSLKTICASLLLRSSGRKKSLTDAKFFLRAQCLINFNSHLILLSCMILTSPRPFRTWGS